MLDISRLEAGKMDFTFSKVKIAEFVEEVAEEFRFVCAKKDITLTIINPEDLNPTITTDPEKLKQVFTNLLGNAYKFTPENGKITILVEKHPKKKSLLQFSVIDTGVGIAKDQLNSVFEKFHQAQNYLQKSYAGTGLGLSIVKKILENINGDIWVTSTEGEGACFSFTLPLK